MDGFFITVNCSQIIPDSSETSYKIFIDKSKMSIVYELKEWIRFMFNLENCFFLIHDNAVIHEIEDIKILEILKHLDTRPCLQSECIHKRIEKTLFSKLNLFTYWNEVKVHKLFVARQNNLTQKVSHNLQYFPKAKEKSSTFLLESSQNTFLQLDESKLPNNEDLTSSHLGCAGNEKTSTDSYEIHSTEKNQLNNMKEMSSAVGGKNSVSDEIKTPENFHNYKKSISLSSKSNGNMSLCIESTGLTLPVNQKPKIQSEPKELPNKRKKSRGEVPFALGTLLSDIRKKAQNYELKENEDILMKESLNSICLQNEKKDSNIDTPAEKDFVDNVDDFVRRKRKRRRHKKQNLKVDINPPLSDYSWDHQESSFSTKPNHIRFSDANEIVETEATNNSSNTTDSRSEDSNSFKVHDSLISTVQLTPEPTPVVKENEDKKEQDEVSQVFTEFNNGRETVVALKDKEVEECVQIYSPLESLKKRVKASGIISRFY